MKASNKIFIFTAIIASLFLCSCKKAAKDVAENVIEKSTKKGVVKETTKEIAEKRIKRIGRLDGSMQTAFANAMNKDHRFYEALASSETVLAECKTYAKEAPKLMKDPNFIRMYVKSDISRKEGRQCIINNLIAKEENDFIKFYTKDTKKLIAEYRDGIVNVLDRSFMSQELIPNACYTVKYGLGKKCSYFIDDLGRISSVEAKNMLPDEIVSDIINRTRYNDFGDSWDNALRKLKQSSKTDDVNVKCVFTYSSDDAVSPKYARIDADINGKKQIASSFENISKRTGNLFSAEENAKFVEKYASNAGLSVDESNRLFSKMNAEDDFAQFIHENPQDIKRWRNTQNLIDEKEFTLIPNPGKESVRKPINARSYANNVYYFNPHLNPGLKTRLRNNNDVINLKKAGNLSYDDLIKLDKTYPDGVPFTKEGFPDFSKVAEKGKDGKPIKIDIGQLSGNSTHDRDKAEELFLSLGYEKTPGYTWHHIENSTQLIRVPTIIHQLVDHSGGMSTARSLSN